MDKKTQAKKLYLHSDKTQKEIADILDVNSKTLYLWIRQGYWEEMKIAARQAPTAITQDLYSHIDAINERIRSREDRCPTPQEVDMLRKLVNTINNLKKCHVGFYTESYMELINFIKVQNPAIHKEVAEIADLYLRTSIFQVSKNIGYRVNDALQAEKEMEQEQHALHEEDAPSEDTPNQAVHAQVEVTSAPVPVAGRAKSGIVVNEENKPKSATAATSAGKLPVSAPGNATKNMRPHPPLKPEYTPAYWDRINRERRVEHEYWLKRKQQEIKNRNAA